DEPDGTKTTYIVDLEKLLEKGDASLDMKLWAGDFVFVPDAASIFIEGAVINPGTYPVREGKTTVSEAIVMAGGTASFARRSNITLIRNLNNGGKQSLQLNLNKIREGQMEDPVLNEKDVVIVGASGFKRFFYGLRINA
ncbi:MAG: SLBB domain-containing protein, partial [Thermodesulfobacteriota bacterium]